MVHSGCTDPNQGTAHLVIVLVLTTFMPLPSASTSHYTITKQFTQLCKVYNSHMFVVCRLSDMLLVQPFSQDGKIVLRAMPSGRFYSLLASFNFVPLLCKLNPTIILFILFQVSSSCHDILVWWFLDKALMPEIQILKKLQQ